MITVSNYALLAWEKVCADILDSFAFVINERQITCVLKVINKIVLNIASGTIFK